MEVQGYSQRLVFEKVRRVRPSTGPYEIRVRRRGDNVLLGLAGPVVSNFSEGECTNCGENQFQSLAVRLNLNRKLTEKLDLKDIEWRVYSRESQREISPEEYADVIDLSHAPELLTVILRLGGGAVEPSREAPLNVQSTSPNEIIDEVQTLTESSSKFQLCSKTMCAKLAELWGTGGAALPYLSPEQIEDMLAMNGGFLLNKIVEFVKPTGAEGAAIVLAPYVLGARQVTIICPSPEAKDRVREEIKFVEKFLEQSASLPVDVLNPNKQKRQRGAKKKTSIRNLFHFFRLSSSEDEQFCIIGDACVLTLEELAHSTSREDLLIVTDASLLPEVILGQLNVVASLNSSRILYLTARETLGHRCTKYHSRADCEDRGLTRPLQWQILPSHGSSPNDAIDDLVAEVVHGLSQGELEYGLQVLVVTQKCDMAIHFQQKYNRVQGGHSDVPPCRRKIKDAMVYVCEYQALSKLYRSGAPFEDEPVKFIVFADRFESDLMVSEILGFALRCPSNIEQPVTVITHALLGGEAIRDRFK